MKKRDAQPFRYPTKTRLFVSTLLISIVLAIVTVALAAAGNPNNAGASPVVLLVFWFVVLYPTRLLIWRRRKSRARAETVQPEND